MAQIFHPSFNTLSKVSIFAGVFLAGGVGLAALQIAKGPFVTELDNSVQQPVPFSHKHHNGGLGFDCRTCHSTVEESGFAGLPPTKTCMGCHSVVWNDAPMLEPVRESYRTDESIDWVRVHDLPEFVYFNHSVHVKKGVGCEECHGRVDQMPLVRREHPLTMAWCLDCHRDPEPRLRPREDITVMGWEDEYRRARQNEGKSHEETSDMLAELRASLAKEYKVEKLTNCSVCHR